MIPDKIYVGVGTLSSIQPAEEYAFPGWQEKPYSQIRNEEYIRKDALLEWINAQLEILWELLPDASNDNPTQMELRYLGQYMQLEALEDKVNEM